MKLAFVDTSVLFRCYNAFVIRILEYCSPVWGSAADCRLLERQVCSVARLCLFRISCHCVIDVVLLECMLYKVIRTESLFVQ